MKKIVLPTKVRSHRVGCGRKVGTVVPKTNFAVTFALVRQSPTKKGKAVFTKVIERIGPETVAVLNIVLGGKPLLSHRKADFKKEPTQFHPITGGWYVEANSSIAAK